MMYSYDIVVHSKINCTLNGVIFDRVQMSRKKKGPGAIINEYVLYYYSIVYTITCRVE